MPDLEAHATREPIGREYTRKGEKTMAMTKGEIRSWLDSISDSEEDEIAIDEGGLTLFCVDAPDIYLEVGGNHICDDDCRSNGCPR